MDVAEFDLVMQVKAGRVSFLFISIIIILSSSVFKKVVCWK